MEDQWEALGLTLLSSDNDNNIVLFSHTDELQEFRERLDAYDGPIPAGQRRRRYEGFINRIGEISTLQPRDRLGSRLKDEGFTDVTDFLDNQNYTVDIELWEFGPLAARRRKAEEIEKYIHDQGGEVFDIYSGPSITLLRVHAQGRVLRPIFSVPEVAYVDLPPQPDLEANDLVELELDDLPNLAPFDPELPLVAILDSGVNDHPFLEDIILEHLAFPEELGEADVWGHGTSVGGIAALGDLRSQLNQPQIQRVARIISAKVVTDQGQFFDRRTLPTQMRNAVATIASDYGCRIFVISLGDLRARFERGRVGPWATTLDELAREFNILIFVSAGNRSPRGGPAVEQAVTDYPDYLLEEANRLCEPAGGVNIVTVGAIAHSNGIGPEHEHDAHVVAITEPLEPSPFTRVGPGAGRIKKPDFVDFGGTMVFDAVTASLQRAPQIPSAGLITTNNDFLRQLFTSKSGTSFAAPMMANKAAQLLRLFPDASANRLKALMAGAAEIPRETVERMVTRTEQETAQVCGNGLVNLLKAAYSDDHRVVLFAEDSLEIDQFAVYSIPIPPEFQNNGARTIRVSLSFDPPVKRTRAEYIGTKMNFRLVRGCQIDRVFDHFRTHVGEDGDAEALPSRFNCGLQPGPNSRDKNTVQTASVTYKRSTENYGDEYHLVVRCVGGWAADQEIAQRFAVVVELEHHAEVNLYTRIRQRIRV